MTVAYLAQGRPGWRLLALCGLAAALADADFLFPVRHRGASHSLGAAVIAFGAMVPFVRARVALLVGLSYATHVLFDWLGADSSSPRGLMALWPVSTTYVISDLDVFNSVDRRYWLEGFWWRNAVAVAREVAILGPLTLLARWAGSSGGPSGGGKARPSGLTPPAGDANSA